MKGKSALTLLLAGIFSCGTCRATGAEVTSESVFNILNSTRAATDKSYLSLNPDKYPNYRLLIHSAKLQNEIKSHYTKDEIQGLFTLTENTRKLALTEKPRERLFLLLLSKMTKQRQKPTMMLSG